MTSSFPPETPSGTTSATPCPKCATPGTGRFCAECGVPLKDATCGGCGNPLTPGSKFCHRCGAVAGAAPVASTKASGMATTLPWAVAGIAFLTLFAMLAGKGFNTKRGSSLDAPMNALPNPALDGGPMGAGGAGMGGAGPMAGAGGPGGVRGPDISNMSPVELAERLFDRVMLLNSQGKTDSVQFFAPMAMQAYDMLKEEQGGKFDLDQRYDMGRIAEAAGALPLAKSQADTILKAEPNHLLGLILATRVAKLSGNTPSATEYAQKFAKVKASELAKNRPEYEKHQTDIAAGPLPNQ